MRLTHTIKPLAETLKCVLMISRDKVKNKSIFRFLSSFFFCHKCTTGVPLPTAAVCRLGFWSTWSRSCTIHLMKRRVILMEIDVTFHASLLCNSAPVSLQAFRDEHAASRLKVVFVPPPPAKTLPPPVSNRANALRVRCSHQERPTSPRCTPRSSIFLSCDILKWLPALKIHERDQLSVNGERRRWREGCEVGWGLHSGT